MYLPRVINMNYKSILFSAILFLSDCSYQFYYLGFQASAPETIDISLIEDAVIEAGWIIARSENGIIETNERSVEDNNIKLLINVRGNDLYIQPEVYRSSYDGCRIKIQIVSHADYLAYFAILRGNLAKKGLNLGHARAL